MKKHVRNLLNTNEEKSIKIFYNIMRYIRLVLFNFKWCGKLQVTEHE